MKIRHIWARSAVVGLFLLAGIAMAPEATAQGSPRLVQPSSLVKLGTFRLPGGQPNRGFEFGGTGLAHNPANNSLYIVGHDWDQLMAEVTIPSLGGTASVLQSLTDPSEGNGVGSGDTKIGGALVYQGMLWFTKYLYYDGNGTQSRSHFSRPLALTAAGQVTGPQPVGSRLAGFVSGYLGQISPEWQAALGGTVLTGNCCLSVISRTSFGPAAFAWTPGQTAATPLVYYTVDHQTLGTYGASGSHPAFNGTTRVKGIVFPEGTDSVLFFGRTGTGPYCYGEAASCGDPTNIYKGEHAYPYRMYVWAYDAKDLAAVKAGSKQPWQVVPYAAWDLGIEGTNEFSGSAAYDPATGRIFVSQVTGAGELPLIHVFSVEAAAPAYTPTPTPTPTPAPTPTPTPAPSSGGGTGCNGCNGSAPGSGWICVNGDWVPPGHPLAAACSGTGGGTPVPTPAPAPTPGPTPSPSGGTSCSGCNGSAPGIGWICVNGGWVPPGHPLAAACLGNSGGTPAFTPAPTPIPTPTISPNGGTSCSGCTGNAPGNGWICVNGGWVPPGHPLAAACLGNSGGTPAFTPAPTPIPTPTISPNGGTSCSGCTGDAPGNGWICVNLGWVPPGHPLAAACSPGRVSSLSAGSSNNSSSSGGLSNLASGDEAGSPRPDSRSLVSWARPGPIAFGTPLGAHQLNAMAAVPGTFVYAPTAGTVLAPGVHSLSVTFTPADAATYETATVTVSCVVRPVRSDVNGDGRPDLVSRDAETGDVYVWVLDGSTAVRAGWIGQMPDPRWMFVATGDFNNDGQLDLVWRNAETGQNCVWFMEGGLHRWTQALDSWPDPAWQIVDATDMDGDGQDDVVWENATLEAHGVWFLHGVTYVGSAALPAPTADSAEAATGERWALVGVDDFDADGRLDLVWRSTATGDILIGDMNGIARGVSGGLPSLPDLTWAVVLVADFDGNGYPDILGRHEATGTIGIWFRNGSFQ